MPTERIHDARRLSVWLPPDDYELLCCLHEKLEIQHQKRMSLGEVIRLALAHYSAEG